MRVWIVILWSWAVFVHRAWCRPWLFLYIYIAFVQKEAAHSTPSLPPPSFLYPSTFSKPSVALSLFSILWSHFVLSFINLGIFCPIISPHPCISFLFKSRYRGDDKDFFLLRASSVLLLYFYVSGDVFYIEPPLNCPSLSSIVTSR